MGLGDGVWGLKGLLCWGLLEGCLPISLCYDGSLPAFGPLALWLPRHAHTHTQHHTATHPSTHPPTRPLTQCLKRWPNRCFGPARVFEHQFLESQRRSAQTQQLSGKWLVQMPRTGTCIAALVAPPLIVVTELAPLLLHLQGCSPMRWLPSSPVHAGWYAASNVAT